MAKFEYGQFLAEAGSRGQGQEKASRDAHAGGVLPGAGSLFAPGWSGG